MKAVVVNEFDQAPVWTDFTAPEAREGEVLVRPCAAAISQLVRAQAEGRHYSSGKTLPLVPGADGVGHLPDGQRVYFAFSRAPVGAMAEEVAVDAQQCVAVPAAVDDVTAAAIANPGMSSWVALMLRANFQAGESVLINGAAGASGRLAIQIARHLGAGRIVATARNPEHETTLRGLGADAFIALNQPEEVLTDAFVGEIAANGVDVVLDYLWGPPAGCLLNAIARETAAARFVNIGSMAGMALPLSAGALRSTDLTLMGSGLGSVSKIELVQAVGQVLAAVTLAGLQVDAVAVPASQVAQAWQSATTQRQVLTFSG